ncbi:MAG: MATE family efflux transporter [Proteobacteria bacterium]|nr:MATE family efflux transporter [Pseudomonadota bacterium]
MVSQSPLIGAPLGPTMLRLGIPGIIGALLTSLPGLVEATFLKSSGSEALAAVALVYPLVILAGMFSAGAFGGAVSGFVARALGAGDHAQANGVLVCAVLISIGLGALMWLFVIAVGPLIYEAATDNRAISEAAHYYATILFPFIPLFWLINMLSSVLRGAGDMIRPAFVAACLLVSYSLFAWWLIPSHDVATNDAIRLAALAMAGSYCTAFAATIYFVARNTQAIRFRVHDFNMALLVRILKQGSLAATQSFMTVLYALVTTLIFSRYGTDWLAGYGLAVRLELIMIPMIFGMGASLIAIVGAYAGAQRRAEAIAIAWQGILINVALMGTIGLALALMPDLWCGLVGSDTAVIGACSKSLQFIAPTYVFLALGLSCYFVSQALDTLALPVFGSFVRLAIVVSGLLWITPETVISAALGLVAVAAACYGIVVGVGLKLGPWRTESGRI